MKECKYCRTKYDDNLAVCPNCGGTKVVTAEELAEETAIKQREVEYREKANAAPEVHKKRLIGILAAVVVVVIVVIAVISINANKPLSNGMTKDEGEEVFAAGIAYLDNGNYEVAIDCFLQLPPDSKQYEEARSLLLQSQDAYRSEIIERVNSHVEKGEYDSAFTLINRAQELLPDDSELKTSYDKVYVAYVSSVLDQVNIYVSEGQHEMALAYLNSVQSKYPNDTALQDSYSNTLSAYRVVVRTEAIEQADAYVADSDYENAIKTLNDALDKIGQDEELSAIETVYYNQYKTLAFQEIDSAYAEGGYESAIGLLNSYQGFFSNDYEFNEKNDYYKTLKPISPFSLSPYKTSGTWGVKHYPSYEDALGKSHDDVYINSGTSYGLAPITAWAQYYIESEYKTLSGEIAFTSSSGSGYLEILSGSTVIFTSPSVRGTDGSIKFSVDISDVDLLGIQIRSGRDTGWGSDDWNCNYVMLIGLMLRK